LDQNPLVYKVKLWHTEALKTADFLKIRIAALLAAILILARCWANGDLERCLQQLVMRQLPTILSKMDGFLSLSLICRPYSLTESLQNMGSVFKIRIAAWRYVLFSMLLLKADDGSWRTSLQRSR
jgi:hypothetical protein